MTEHPATFAVHASSEDNSKIELLLASDGINFICVDDEAPRLPGFAVVGLTCAEARAFAQSILRACDTRLAPEPGQ